MIYQPDQRQDNPEIAKIAEYVWNCREHQISTSEFHRWEDALRKAHHFRGYQIDILCAAYVQFQQQEISWANMAAHSESEFRWHLSNGWYEKRQHRAVGLLSNLATKGVLTTEQNRMLDQIIRSEPRR